MQGQVHDQIQTTSLTAAKKIPADIVISAGHAAAICTEANFVGDADCTRGG
jgi:hypothetical protein